MIEQAKKLKEQGLSLRAIGADLGVSHTQVRVLLEPKLKEKHKISEQKRRDDEPEYRERYNAARRDKWQNDPEYRAERLADMRKRDPEHRSVTYFLSCPLLDKVKIGKTNNLSRRLRELQCGNPEDLILLGVCDHNEAELHVRFANEHVIREWFYLSPRIRTFIETECRGTP